VSILAPFWRIAPVNVKIIVKLVFWHVLHKLLADRFVVANALNPGSYARCFDRLPRNFFALVHDKVVNIVQDNPNPVFEDFVPLQDRLAQIWRYDQHLILQKAVWDHDQCCCGILGLRQIPGYLQSLSKLFRTVIMPEIHIIYQIS